MTKAAKLLEYVSKKLIYTTNLKKRGMKVGGNLTKGFIIWYMRSVYFEDLYSIRDHQTTNQIHWVIVNVNYQRPKN